MMGPGSEALLHDKQLHFVGRMLTALTQSVPEHLATLQGAVERLARLLDQAGQGSGETHGKLVELLGTMQRHLDRLQWKTRLVQRLGQRMGAGESPFDPVEVIEEAILFSNRQAQVAKASIRLETDKTLPRLKNDPVSLHFLVVLAIHRMLERVEDGGEVLVRADTWERGIRITVAAHGTLAPAARSEGEMAGPCWSVGQRVAASLGGELQPVTLGPYTEEISLYLPVERDLKVC